MESLWQDVRHALRQFRTQRQFTIAALLVLGLGIGANATIFTVVDRVLLTPLPYRAPDDLVMIWEKNVPSNFSHNVVNPQNYVDWKDRSKSFSDMAAFTWSQMVLLGGGAPERVYGRSVTPNLFALLGARPALGRTFTAEESRPKGPTVVILSDKLWRRRYAADPQIVGKTIEVSGGNSTVVGVMPADFRPLSNEEYWDPFPLDPSDRSRHGRYAMAIGRLKSGVTRAQAEADVTAIGAQLEKEYPSFDTGWRVSVVGLADEVVGSSKSVILVLFGAVSLVLLITCANVGNLMLTRAASRRREVAVRTALGATRWRLAREWMVENLILAIAGGAIGLILTAYAVDLLVASSPSGVPRLHEIALDGRVIAATALVTIIVGLVIGAPAALQERTTRLAADLQGASARTAGSVQAARFRSVLVVAQMSLAVVLLLASGLLVRSVARLAQVDPGFDPKGVLTLGVTLPNDKYPDLARQAAFFNELSTRLGALPGVEKVGAVSFLPLQNGNAGTGFVVVGQPEPAPGMGPSASVRITDPGYFSAMRIPVLQGRALSAADREGTPRVVVVSELLAKKIWPNGDAIGQRIKVYYGRPDDTLEVVGIVGDVRHSGLDEEVYQTIYYPASQYNYGALTYVIRTAGPPANAAPAVRAALHELDPNVPAEDVGTMDHWVTRSMSDRRDPMLVLTIFAALAVTIAAVGVYAVLSFGVSQRTREIGVRMALGAQPREVLSMVLGGGMRLTLIGITLGVIGGAIATRALDKLLFHVQPTDPLTIGAVALLLGIVALVAMYVPARRAARVDPVVALRSE
jgi:putative ABC transport system permease protein